jgi:hypothetical protein
MKEIALRKQRLRQEGKEAFDNLRQIRQKEIEKGNIVLKHDPQTEIDRSHIRKLAYRWEGPYRVRKVIQKKGTYLLEDFDGSLLPGTYAGNRLKKFVEQEGFYEAISPNDEESEQSPEEEENDKDIGDDIEYGVIETGVGTPNIENSEKSEGSINKNGLPDYLPMDFKILLPELDES